MLPPVILSSLPNPNRPLTRIRSLPGPWSPHTVVVFRPIRTVPPKLIPPAHPAAVARWILARQLRDPQWHRSHYPLISRRLSVVNTPQVALPDWLIAQSILLLQHCAHLSMVCYERAQHRAAVDVRPIHPTRKVRHGCEGWRQVAESSQKERTTQQMSRA